MQFVMDAAGDLPEEYVARYDVTVVPINVAFGQEQFRTGIDMDHSLFYEKAEAVSDDNFPKTSQPTPYQFVQAYRRILEQKGRDILTVTVSEKLSGTYASAVAAAEELTGQGNFYLVDSKAGSAAQGWMIIQAAELARQGAKPAEILAALERMRDEMVIVFLVKSLDFAVRGGRVSSLSGTMASLLRIQPILTVEDGLIVEAGKVRTYRKALRHIVSFVAERVGQRPVRLAFIHARAPEGAAELRRQANERLNVAAEFVQEMSVSVAINLGPGALGIVAFPTLT
ncbi:MAG: DegV family protein [Candidatus Promineifilaceae bacterium]|nr:DegV family protein [Candidatus Promineifilaceae bacterium]